MSKMKINNGATKNGKTTNDVSLILVQEISMAVPLRKKVTIDITPSHIQARDANSNEVLAKTIYRWDQIGKCFSLFARCLLTLA